MEEPPDAHLLARCSSPEFASLARAAHSRWLRLGWLRTSVRLVTRLLVAHCRCGAVTDARLLFDEISDPSHPLHPDVVSWNAIISRCVLNGSDDAAFRYFAQMRHRHHPPDSFTISSLLSSSHCSERSFRCGEQLHAYSMKAATAAASAANALVTFYAGWGRLAESALVFRSMPVRDVVSWTALISGHAQRPGYEEESLRLFALMMREDDDFCHRPNEFTFASVLRACGSLASVSQGLQFITLALKLGLLKNIHVQNSLIGFFSDCGCPDEAKSVFETIADPDNISWNSLLKGYSRGGRGREALRDFQEMLARGAKPDSITFLCLLSACAHCGMTPQGLELFERMEEFRIEPGSEHVSCVVNLLGRAGELHRAMEFVEKVRSEPGVSAWKTLLGACRVHGGAEEVAELAARRLVELEPRDTEARVVLSHVYAAREKWDLVASMRWDLKEKGLVKERGSSWITVGCKVRRFAAGDGGHPEMHEVEKILMELVSNMTDQAAEEQEEKNDNIMDVKQHCSSP